jgi:hypothetical protein
VRSDPRYKALLESLGDGQVVWLKAAGNSLWPVVLSGDSLRVERCGPDGVGRGDIAVVEDPHGRLLAHLVVQAKPVRTASTNGRLDEPPKAVLGRVTAVRRGALVFPVPRLLAPVLGGLPGVSRLLRRVPGAAGLVRRLRDR